MRVLYGVSTISLVCAGVLCAWSVRQWAGDTPESGAIPRGSAVDQFRTHYDHSTRPERDTVAPIVEQAARFALYLDPPKPPAPAVTVAPPATLPPVSRPPVVSPKFRLLAISYYHASPERSLAMVSEPGRGTYWIGQGDHVGYLVVERIAEDGIVYRDGNQSHEMKVDVKNAAPIAQLKSTLSAAVPRVAGTGGH